jgi:hypothetical protein
MSFLRRLFGGKDADGGHKPPSMPWDPDPPILEFVRSHIVPGKPGMSEDGNILVYTLQTGSGDIDVAVTNVKSDQRLAYLAAIQELIRGAESARIVLARPWQRMRE